MERLLLCIVHLLCTFSSDSINVEKYQGQYLYLDQNEGFTASAGDEIELISPLLRATPSSGECLSFWFFMLSGAVEIGNLQVILREGQHCAVCFFLPQP